ncbi:MAG: hypothetical protein Q8N30_15745 [Methylococcales bacterium]|nr:hypothetical protein [Methylococcales bacterium]
MKNQIFELIKKRDHVSFAELCRDIPDFSGEFIFYNSALENLILWDNISQEGVDAMKHLLSNSQIFIRLVAPE